MPRPPDPEGKTKRLVLVGKEEWNEELRAFKEICARNGLTISDELYQRAVKSFLRDHHWPPGNSQTLIAQYEPDYKPEIKGGKCCFCSKQGTYTGEYKDKKYYVCNLHKRQVRKNRNWGSWQEI